MSIKLNIWMPLYIGDYLSDTSRLTFSEHGAYLLLIMDYWKNGPLPNDDLILARIIGANITEWETIKRIVKSFFNEEGEKLRHKRIDIEISRIQESSAKKVDRAKKGAAARWSHNDDATSNATSIAQASSKQCSSNAKEMLSRCYTDTDTDTYTYTKPYSDSKLDSQAESNTNLSEPSVLQEKSKSKSKTNPCRSDDATVLPFAEKNDGSREIFSHWQEVMQSPGSKMDVKRKRLIDARLKEGYSVSQLKTAVSGCAKSDYHMGINDRSAKYNSIDLIFRNADKVDQFIALYDKPKVRLTSNEQITINSLNSLTW